MDDPKIDPELKIAISGFLFELNNSLVNTLGYCTVAMEKLDPATPAHSDVAHALKSAERSSKVFREIEKLCQPKGRPVS